MKTKITCSLTLFGLGSLAALAYLAGLASGTGPAPPPVADKTKRKIEKPTEDILRLAAKLRPPAGASDNPKVEPGKVRWHPNLAAARAAAGKSKKPVLLFHLLGRLDRQFC
jgi:hypothetical protein